MTSPARAPTRVAVVIAALLALTAAACGESPPSSSEVDAAQDPQAAATAPAAGATALDEVYAQVDGLTGDERRDRLIELTEAEGGAVSVYGTLNIEELGPILDAFEEETGVAPELYRSSSNQMLQRLLQEAEADFAGADVVNISGAEMPVLNQEELLLPLMTPATEPLVEAAVYDTWAGIQLNVFTPVWNTDLVSEEEAPQTWEDVLMNFQDGGLVMDIADFDWFAALVGQYFVERQGMAEEEAVALFEEAAAGGAMVDGHTLMTELVAAGEYRVAADAFAHAPLLREDIAPVAWQPAVEPLVVRPNGVGIHRDTDAPAASLLFIEFMLDEGQQMLADIGRTPASTAVEGGIPEDVELISVDVEQLFEEREKWEGLYEGVVRNAGADAGSEDG